MAEYPTYTAADVAGASGADVTEYSSFIDEALKQATLLFKIGTCLSQFPDSELDAELAKYGILAMADAIFSVQPFQKVLRTPFSSETIGSYSYSKLTSAVSAGLPTGVSWFDIAVGKLSVCDTVLGLPMSGGYSVFEEHKKPHGGYGVYLGPADQNPDTWAPDTFDPPEVD
jgi:hypothetical protein